MSYTWKLIILANITGIAIGLFASDSGYKRGLKSGYTDGYQAIMSYEHGR